MSSRIILALAQLAVGWFAAPYIVAHVPRLGALGLFVYAIVYAALVWLVGLVLSRALKDARTPSRDAFVGSLIGALIGAAVITVVIAVVPGLLVLLPGVPARAYPLLGAILGYLMR